jgi:ApbE superfamily uncharacterized protein (UPF0280 family)
LSRAAERFQTVLQELVDELDTLRMPVHEMPDLAGKVARSMHGAAANYSDVFVTPMAAVAGAVADEIRDAVCAGDGICKAYINNGGDVALHLGPGEKMIIAVAGSETTRIEVTGEDSVRGIATSGWRGRSYSLGIADSVTVLAQNAVQADVAATLIANAVDLPGSHKIVRQPANLMSPDSDLQNRMVTMEVAALTETETNQALSRGVEFALRCQSRGLVQAVFLNLGTTFRIVGSRKYFNSQIKDFMHA